VPEDEGQVVVLLPFLTQLEQGSLPAIGVHEIDNETVYLSVLLGTETGTCIVVGHELPNWLVGNGVGEGCSRKWGSLGV
jgi:hypothetical protein